jgi:lysozyme
MKVSDKGVAELLSHEAMVTSPYRDSVGVWTVGVGHTASAGKPNPQTMAKGTEVPLGELVALFRRDLAKYEADVNNAVKVDLKQHEFDALVSFHFNTGAIARASLVKNLNAGDRMGAAEGMLEWKKPAEIIERRRKEMKLFRDGKYSNDGKCSIYPADRNGRVQWGSGRRVLVASLIAHAPAPAPKPEPPPAPAPAPAFRNDGKHETPASERSWWQSVLNKLTGKEP